MHSRLERNIYNALMRVPPGRVITYKDLAGYIGCESARAVGNALAKNPFPIIIPCHRVVRTDRKPGGFTLPAGRRNRDHDLKKALLELEGVTFDKNGKIPKKFFI